MAQSPQPILLLSLIGTGVICCSKYSHPLAQAVVVFQTPELLAPSACAALSLLAPGLQGCSQLIGFSFSFMLSHFKNSELKEKGMYLLCLTLQIDLSSLISTLSRHYKHTSLYHPKPPLDLSPVQCPGKQSRSACCLVT